MLTATIGWSGIRRPTGARVRAKPFRKTVEARDVMADLTSCSERTENDGAEIAGRINEHAHDHVESESE